LSIMTIFFATVFQDLKSREIWRRPCWNHQPVSILCHCPPPTHTRGGTYNLCISLPSRRCRYIHHFFIITYWV